MRFSWKDVGYLSDYSLGGIMLPFVNTYGVLGI